jgi:hypothetical protein
MGDVGSRLIALDIFSPAYRIRGYFLFSMAWCLELAAFFVYGQLLWVDGYPSSLLPISCVSTTS